MVPAELKLYCKYPYPQPFFNWLPAAVFIHFGNVIKIEF